MKRIILAACVLGFLACSPAARAADDKDAAAVVDKAVKAVGGPEKLAAAKGFMWKTKGVITFGGNDNEMNGTGTAQGADHFRQEFEGNFGGNPVKAVTVLAGDKGWRKFGDDATELEKDRVAGERHNVFLQLAAINPLLLKEKGVKVEPAGEDKVGDKPAVGLKVTTPDGKDFKMFFDKETGLPAKQVAKVTSFQGDEVTQEMIYTSYKDFGGIKKATKIEGKREGEPYLKQEVTEFKVLDKAPEGAFTEPK